MKNTFKTLFGLLIFLMASLVGFASASVEPTSSDHDVGWLTYDQTVYDQCTNAMQFEHPTMDVGYKNKELRSCAAAAEYTQGSVSAIMREKKKEIRWPAGNSKSSMYSHQGYIYSSKIQRHSSLKFGMGTKRLS